ncbi:MAG: MFS transporter [Dehalococcoidia bacterium]|nr:MAG: MFS transporter [Dehalococcoidia bacterium]
MPATTDDATRRALQRNLRILPLWWATRWIWLGEAIWVVYLTRERGLTLGEVLLFQAVYSAVVIAGEVPTGMMADRWGRRLSVILGSAVAVGAMAIFGLGHTIPVLLASYAMFSLADALFSGADSAILFALDRDDEFTRWQARELVVGGASMALYTLAGALMVRWVPLEVPFLVSALLSTAGFALAFRLVDPPREGERHSFSRIGVRAAREVLGRRTLLTAALLMALTTATIHTMGITQQPVVLSYGVPVWSLGLFVGSQLAFSALSAAIADRLGRRIGLIAIFLAMPLISALALLGGATGVIWLYPIFILPSLGWNVLWPYVSDYIARRVEDNVRATALSVASVLVHLTSVALLPLFGFAIDRRGLDAGLAIASLGLALTALALFAVWWRAGDHASAAAEAYPVL